MFLIYLLTNPHTGLSYVGYTKHYAKRMYEHRYHLTVKCTDFHRRVLFDGIPTRDEALEMEKVFIDVYGTFDNGYNRTRGGGRTSEHSEETKRKMAAAKKDSTRVVSTETKRKMALAHRRPEYDEAKAFFCSFLPFVDLRQRRKELRKRYPHIPCDTIYRWIKEWKGSVKIVKPDAKLIRIVFNASLGRYVHEFVESPYKSI